MKYFNNYQQIVHFVIKHHITSINELLSVALINVAPLSDFEEEQHWIDHHIDGTFGLLARLVLVRADLSASRYKLAVLHECCHILLGHQGNFKLSSLPQAGSPEEHEANMGAYCLLMIFRYYDTNEVRKDFQEIADTYELPYSEIENLIEVHQFINSQLRVE